MRPPTLPPICSPFGRLFALAFAGAAALNAQTATTPSLADHSQNDETVVLSPFVVSSEREDGYQAMSTLVGTRLSTPLSELGASVSVYTKDFLADINATSANELLVFATGMEAAGTQGNYSGAANDINAAETNGDEPRTQPQNATRTRGLASPNYTRGLFATSIPMDSYNTESVTISRGPNAVLFGVGSPAGVVDTGLLQPNLTRNRAEFEVRYGNNNALRSTADINHVLIPKQLAVRLAFLNDEERYNQRPAFEHKKRVYGAVTYQPFRSTVLRSNFETGNSHANRPITVLPFNSVSEAWYEAGMPMFDWSYYDDPARNPLASSQNATNFVPISMGQAQFFDQVGIVYSQSDAKTWDFAFRGGTPSSGSPQLNRIRNNVIHPLLNRDLAGDGINFLGTFNIAELPGSYFGAERPAGIKVQGFTDFSAFDFKNRMLDETSWQRDSLHSANIALEQRAWNDRIGIELAYDQQRYDVHAKNSFMSMNQSNHVRVDPNVMLPNGQPNPNVGRPYMIYGQSRWPHRYSEREAFRATAYLRYDFNDLKPGLGKWFGRHSLTGLYEDQAHDRIDYHTRLVTFGEIADSISTNIGSTNRRPGIFAYIGPSVLDTGGKLILEPIRIPEIPSNMIVPTSYFSAPATGSAQGDIAVTNTYLSEQQGGGEATREVIKSQAAVLHSNWLSNHLITTIGWRRDEDYYVREEILRVQDLNKPHYSFEDFDFPSTPPLFASKEIKSYSAVVRWPNGLIRLPFGADLSVFGNRSENFTPVGGRVNMYGDSLPSPEGKTEEIGFLLSLPSNKLSLRVARFETAVKNASFSASVIGTAFNNATLQQAGFWVTSHNTAPQVDRWADIEKLFSTLPANFRDIHNWRVTGSAAEGNLGVSSTPLAGVTDTTDYTAKGTEVEIIANPTRELRLALNVAKQETVQTNSAPNLKDFVERMRPIWDSFASKPRGSYPENWVPGTPDSQLSPNVLRFGEWLQTNVYVPYETILATEGSASAEQRKWRVNFVANYTFARDTRLNGWSVGAGVRWQDKIGIGYPVTTEASGVVRIDVANPYYSPAETNVDAWIGYSRKLWNDRVKWRVRLSARNLIGDDTPIAITAQPWGDVAVARLAPERRWYLTNTFEF
jgi:Outer membrane receptor proteins, mostly Fe transport